MPPRICEGCRNGAGFDIPISMAFQPILSVDQHRIFAYEALLRGADGAPAGQVFERVNDHNRYTFDQTCRSTAIALAARLDLARDGAFLSINFLPNAVYDPRACIRVTLDTADRTGFPTDRIMFEFTESEKVCPDHLLDILRHYRKLGFLTAIDDFGAGFAGLNLLSEFVPDVVKIDMHLVRNCDNDRVKHMILDRNIALLRDLGVTVICEGIETAGEYAALRDLGVDLMQGYFFARPGFETLPDPVWPARAEIAVARSDAP